jgi:hypothetical protein
MDRFWMRTVIGVLAASAIGVLSSACAHNDSTLFIQEVMAPPPTKTGTTCSYVPSPQAAFLSQGTFDIGLATSYEAVLQLGNQMVQRGPAGPGSDPVHTETSRIVINGAEVSVADATGAVIGNFTSVATSFVDVGATGIAGLGAVGITAIDAKTASTLCGQFADPATRHQLVLTIKAFGKTLGGTDVESQDFTFPVTVCKGCLVDYSSACVPAAGSMTTVDSSKIPCQVGADSSIPCQACATSYPAICADKLDPAKFKAFCAAAP